jgi:hypothetical protein
VITAKVIWNITNVAVGTEPLTLVGVTFEEPGIIKAPDQRLQCAAVGKCEAVGAE